MNNKIPQIVKRNIGSVDIVDLRGEFVGPWALRGKDEISQFVANRHTKNLLVNLKGLDTVDSLGVKAITENLKPEMRCALITGNLSVMEMFSRISPVYDLKFFQTEEEVIDFFGADLVSAQSVPLYEEKRKHLRLHTALPVQFSYEDDEGEEIHFHAIITDLSEGGMFIEYLDLDQISAGARQLNPYDLKMLDFHVRIPDVPEIHAKGKVIRTIMDEDNQVGMGVEFYHIEDQDLARISEFLE